MSILEREKFREAFDEGVTAARSHLDGLDDTDLAAEIANPKKIHELLFSAGGTIAGTPGEHRSTSMSFFVILEGNVLHKIDLIEPEGIEAFMQAYGSMVKQILEKPLDRDAFISAIAFCWQALISAHPFADGNGRTLRFIVSELCRRTGHEISPKWTLFDRPFGQHFVYASRYYFRNPYLLVGAFQEYIDPQLVDGEESIFHPSIFADDPSRGKTIEEKYNDAKDEFDKYWKKQDEDKKIADSFLKKLTSWLD